MNTYKTDAIVVRRVDYGEYDRIVGFITKDNGKVSALAKGVKKPKSKLAGGIELFSTSQISFLKGKGDLDHVISSRVIRHFGNIIKEYERVEVAYLAIKLVDKITERDVNSFYYHLLANTFALLDDLSIDWALIEVWLRLELLKVLGHMPELSDKINGEDITEKSELNFNVETGQFEKAEQGPFNINHLKTWKLLLNQKPSSLKQVRELDKYANETLDILRLFCGEVF